MDELAVVDKSDGVCGRMIIDDVKIDYGIIDQTIFQDTMRTEASDNSPYSDAKNTINPTTPRSKLAYLEKDYFLLDGTFEFPTQLMTYNVGWESGVLADDEGNIDTYVEYIFGNTHVSYGMQIYFNEEYIAKDFEVSYYKGETLIDTVTVRDNMLARYFDYTAILDWNRVRIHFTKVNAGQRARFYEFTFGITDTYQEDLLLAVSASRATDLTGDYSDNGEFSFTFFNDNRFDITDTKGLSQGLMEWLKVTVWIKLRGETEYRKFGDYFSEMTDVQEKGKIIVINGYDELYKLGETTYNKGVVHTGGQSLGKWAEEVAEDAGIEVVIAPELYDIISTGYITEVPHREALRLIAEAGNCALLINDDGNVELRKVTFEDKGYLTDDEIVEDSLRIENTDKNLGVIVNKHTFLAAKDEVELGHIDSVGLTTQVQQMEITYSTYPVITSSVQIFVDSANTQAKVTNIRAYSDRVVFDISSEIEGEETFVTVTGLPYNTATSQVERGRIIKNVKKIENNFLITGDIAESVADYQMSRAVRKYDYSMETVTDKTLKIGEKYTIQKNKMIVTSVAFSVAYGEHTVNIGGVDE